MTEEKALLEDADVFSQFSTSIRRFGLLPFIFASTGLVFFLIGIVLLLLPEKAPISVIEQGPNSLSKATIQVDIAGAVEQPGVYTLPIGSRVQDGLIAAGGLSAGADRDYVFRMVNQAARLSDGAKVYIPSVDGSTSGQTANKQDSTLLGIGTSLVNINTASTSELDSLPGVGPVTAEKIINGRPYQRIEELVERKVVNRGTWEKIKTEISVF